MKKVILSVFLAVVLAAPIALAQEASTTSSKASSSKPWHPGNYWAVGVQSTFPRSDFGVDYKTGYGLQGMFDYPLIPFIDLSASVGWNHFDGEDGREGVDVFEAALGVRFVIGVFFMNSETGYYSKIDEWNYIPGLGLRFDHWEYSLRTKIAGDNVWSTFRIGYYF